MKEKLKPIRGNGRVWFIHAIIQTISPLIILAISCLIYFYLKD
jgi:hypothetical protein